ncbi:MAG: ABC transporter ATP-binding protein [Pirellulaceae bacterium]|nr:ABC transporter ATP-binding protein [Pirellulaceae bacterium]
MFTTLEPVLAIRDAWKSYGQTPALKGINLDLHAGELLGFLGPNGAGKTTLIQCLAGRARLDSGQIRFPQQGKQQRQQLGVVPQRLALYEDLTAEQNLFAFAKLHAVPRRELRERVDAALHWSNLETRRRKLVNTFSGGMKRRLNIACSVLHRPCILLLDEPTVGVDPQSRERIYEMLSGMRDQGTAVMLTTHHLDEAQHRCDRIAIVDQGQVILSGTLQQLIADTIGSDQRLSVRFHSPPTILPSGFSLDKDRTLGTCTLTNVADELPALMESLQHSQGPIDQVMLQGPTLQNVFLHLTGKELRE